MSEASWCALNALGLSVQAPWPLPGGEAGEPARAGATRPLRVAWAASEPLAEAEWTGAECVFQPPFPDGEPHFSVRRDARGFWLSFDDFGRYTVSPDGRAAACEADAVPVAYTERFLFAQVLPLAAVLQGLDVVHASAVACEGGVAAFVGPSGAGKTTVATRLVARGASLVTDDALALEVSHGAVVAHPGPPFVAIAPTDAALADGALTWLGPRVGASDKPHFAAPVCAGALPLRAVYYLEARAEFGISAATTETVRRLLAHAAAPYVLTPARQLAHLELVSTVTSCVPQFSLTLAAREPSDEELGRLERHIRGLGA